MSKWNLSFISIGCLLILVSNNLEDGRNLMIIGLFIAGFAGYRFIKEVREENKKQKSKK